MMRTGGECDKATRMLDPAIIDAMGHVEAFRAPAIVRDVRDVTGEIEVFRATELKVLERDERATDEWIAQGVKMRDDLWAICVAKPDHTRLTVDRIRQVSSLAEMTAHKEGREFLRMVKKHRRLVKQAFDAAPQRGAVMRELTDRLQALMHRRYEEKLDFAAFLRALAAEYDPAARGGTTLSDPEAIDAFLRAAAA